MVGGQVVGVSRVNGKVLLNVRDEKYGDECAVRCEERRIDNGQRVTIEVGDKVWWQCGTVMWTPKSQFGADPDKGCGRDWDVRLPKIGYSH